ncbi:MAG: undecaprenyldiphospho-muramoylpentapeptide beta-N-acetylglucosaminyltransferase [Clostridiales bacterium]|nr:undecaprenyldiphospho-muramoylpentapeptide beta-N-acetylglucosaminyltransferase [Clostridiales bacterium]
MATLILTGGGTAGHCIPNIALLPYLKDKFDKIYYIGSENGIEKDLISKTNIPFYSVPCVKLSRTNAFENVKLPFKLYSGIKEAKKLIDELNPDVVFSKGGFVSVPTVIAASKKKIPVISHESDLSPGLANKFTAKYCKKVLTTFPETAKKFKNGEFVGSPIRKSLFNDKKVDIKQFGFSDTKPILLVTGGSQGAKVINTALRSALPTILTKFNVIHICGKGNLDNKFNPKGYYQIEYTDKIENAFAVCSVCVSRAGANTLFELLSLKIPCILIPLPKGESRGDQVDNANYFEKLGLVNVLPQENLTPESLAFAINSTYTNRNNIRKNIEKRPIFDASEKIVNILTNYIN